MKRRGMSQRRTFVSALNIYEKQAYWNDSQIYMPLKRAKLLLY